MGNNLIQWRAGTATKALTHMMVSSECAVHEGFGPDSNMAGTLCEIPPSDDIGFCSQTCSVMDNCTVFSMDQDERILLHELPGLKINQNHMSPLPCQKTN